MSSVILDELAKGLEPLLKHPGRGGHIQASHAGKGGRGGSVGEFGSTPRKIALHKNPKAGPVERKYGKDVPRTLKAEGRRLTRDVGSSNDATLRNQLRDAVSIAGNPISKLSRKPMFTRKAVDNSKARAVIIEREMARRGIK